MKNINILSNGSCYISKFKRIPSI